MLNYFLSLNISDKVVVGIFFIIALVLVGLFLKWFVVQLGKFLSDRDVSAGSVSIKKNEGNEEIPEFPKSCHASCANVKDIITLLHSQQLAINRIFHIRDKEILHDQMTYCENKLDILTVNGKKALANLLIDNGITFYQETSEYKYFKILLDDVKEQNIIKFRHMCRQNHFLERAEDDFREYARMNAKIIEEEVFNQVRLHYFYQNSIKNFSKLEELNTIVFDTFVDIIEHARKISKQKQEEITKIQKEFDTSYEKIIGEKPPKILNLGLV